MTAARSASRATRSPPRMSGPPWIGHAVRFRRDPLGIAMEAQRRCGDVAAVDLGRFGDFYYLFHPDDIGELFAKGRRLHRELLRKMLGEGLFIVQTGEAWQRHRRLLQPAFDADHVAKSVERIGLRVAFEVDRRWTEIARTGATIDIGDEMKRITIAIIVAMVLGDAAAENTDVRAALDFVVSYADHRLFGLLKAPYAWPTPGRRRFEASLAVLRDATARAIRERRAEREHGGDLLGAFLAARDAKTGATMTDVELVDEVMSAFVAGTETTGTALTWTLYLLARDPPLAARLGDEAARVLGERRAPTAANVADLRFAKNAVLEAMRLYPPAWAMFRILEGRHEVRGFELPEGARVLVSPYVTHRHPAFWDAPSKYDPDRFTAERSAGRPRFAFFPFGGGAHQCIGSDLALTEAQIVLATIAARFEIALEPNQAIGVAPAIALAPSPSPRARAVARRAVEGRS